MSNKDHCLKLFEEEKSRYIEEWRQFLQFKSISADPSFAKDSLECAKWLVKHLNAVGLESGLLDTSGLPVVYGRREGVQDRPHVLFYGHYDVQPVDPLEEWRSDPFAGQIRNGRMYARGAQDNKGQILYFIKALEALIREDGLKCLITVLIEGEEESGSRGLRNRLESWRDQLKADVLMVCDSGCVRAGVPCITMGIRGLIWLEIRLGGLSHDLHSGSMGGVVRNPATEMARLLATLHGAEGAISVPGYYDGIIMPAVGDKRLADKVPFDAKRFKSLIGVDPDGGEKGFSYAERRGMRPTIDVNGLYAGYGGPGSKTIIPAAATAKLTSRLVAGQDPQRCLDLLLSHLKRHAPPSLKFEILDKGIAGPAVSLSADSPLIQTAKEVLENVGGSEVDFTWEGGSIPIVAALAGVSGAEPLLVGFGSEEDCVHAPNESFSLAQFRDGLCYSYLMLARLSALESSALRVGVATRIVK